MIHISVSESKPRMSRIDEIRSLSKGDEWHDYHGPLHSSEARALVRLYERSSWRTKRRLVHLAGCELGMEALRESVRVLTP